MTRVYRSALILRSSLYLCEQPDDPIKALPELLEALPGDQLEQWLSHYCPMIGNPFDVRAQTGQRPLEDNEGRTEEERRALADELRRCGFTHLPDRIISSQPVPTARQVIERLAHFDLHPFEHY